MADDLPPMPDEETTLPPDPFEAELVAYLDGELDPAAARREPSDVASEPNGRVRSPAPWMR